MQSYNDTWKNCPLSEIIIHNIDKLVTNMHAIYKKKLVVVDDHIKFIREASLQIILLNKYSKELKYK